MTGTTWLMLSAALLALPAYGETGSPPHQPTLNYYGLPGLIDMPTAEAMPDAELAVTGAYFDGTFRGTLAFQATPRITLTFRYAGIEDFGVEEVRLDRSFDIHWQLLQERNWWPAVAVGIRDIAGTGIYGGEYIVATRHFGQDDRLAVTAGLGFGRLGERGGFSNPFGLGERPVRDVGEGGTVNFDQFFRGNAAFFGGVEYQATDRLRLQVEYSSDLYSAEVSQGLMRIESPWNFGLTYDIGQFGTLGAHYLYGTTIGISLSFSNNPSRGAPDLTSYAVPEPLAPRPVDDAPYSMDWLTVPSTPTVLRDAVESRFAEDGGLELVTLYIDPDRATIRVRNLRYGQEAQALGRVLRILARTMPASIEVFEVIFTVNGADASRVRVSRSELEALQPQSGGPLPSLGGASVMASDPRMDPQTMRIWGRERNSLTYGIAPYVETFLFDPEAPIRGAIGAEARARYEFGRGFVAEGVVRVPVLSNLSESRIVDGVEPGGPFPVRSELALYNQESRARVERLTFSHYGHLGGNFYSRVSLGYLERMFAGVSGELLWQPVNSRLGLGVEVNHVWRRDFDGGFGVQDYSVTTGHVSAYFPIWGEFTGQVDVGRYLAGDWGATVRVDREFDNGWRVGAFATLTDVSFEEFGEGSFDKGIEIVVPMSWFTGTASRVDRTATLRPVQRDGGARLSVDGRLHELVTDYHRSNLTDTEGVMWR
ncbi:YjbH domain-containing protein [Rhodobacterales bacterium HKCCSP123]|nr:YjbH domain-containing protein [Rhodobacterales bacterium HKCCSP123]